jgi:3-hydroxy-3-methylglutaryl CoA synthase
MLLVMRPDPKGYVTDGCDKNQLFMLRAHLRGDPDLLVAVHVPLPLPCVQVAKAVHAAVEAALSGQKKQDRLRAQVNHGFNQVSHNGRVCCAHGMLRLAQLLCTAATTASM